MVNKSELQLKDVIDINQGKKLGFIADVDIDPVKGQIQAIMVPSSPSRLLAFFSRKQDIIIKWSDIKKIGEDVILVDV